MYTTFDLKFNCLSFILTNSTKLFGNLVSLGTLSPEKGHKIKNFLVDITRF
jgi:hypothetical protein